MRRNTLLRTAIRPLSTCDLCDKYCGTFPTTGFQVLNRQLAMMRSFGGRKAFSGKVCTVSCFGDNSRVKELASTPGKGRVMVIDGNASLRLALVGDLIAKAASDSGWSGIVVNGAICDVGALANIDLGVFALGSVPVKASWGGRGEVDVELEINEVRIAPDAWIYCDETGIVMADVELSL
jgi:regulator of ribonuclease activity A